MNTPNLQKSWAWARDWLFDEALPLWADVGVDPAGGFRDLIDDARRPVAARKRLRVQGRQVFVFAEAGRAGWPGPWRDLVRHGVDFLRNLPTGDDAPTSATGDGRAVAGASLYDQAFLLLGLALARRATGDSSLELEAQALWRSLGERFGRAGGGFLEPGAGEAAFQSNPHMHLLEAMLAWRRVSPSPLWTDAAQALAGMAREIFIDPATGRIKEFFDAQGRPLPGELGDQTWPGHQFEWGWLLLAHADEHRPCAAHMIKLAAATGVDRAREVAIFAQHGDGTPLDRTARLWSQAERLRGALAIRACPGEDRDYWTLEAIQATGAIRRYADAVGGGLYRDLMLEDGAFVAEPSKASSLYHLTGAFMALRDAAEAER